MKNLINKTKAIALIACAMVAAVATAEAPSTAVLAFDVRVDTIGGAIRQYADQDLAANLGDSMAELVEMELLNQGANLVDRKYLRKLVEEQTRGASGPIDEATAAQIGKLIGAKYVVVGTVNKVELEGKRILVVTELIGRVGATAKVIEVETGRLVTAASESGTKKRTDFDLGGLAQILSQDKRRTRPTSGGIALLGSIPCIGDAAKEVAQKLAKKLITTLSVDASASIDAKVFYANGDEIVVNVEAPIFLKVGDTIKLQKVKILANGFKLMSDAATGTVVSVQGKGIQIRITQKQSAITQDEVLAISKGS